jgi:hypothetical protein
MWPFDPTNLFWIPLCWIAFVIALSIVVRRRAGKVLMPRIADNAIFAERWASGRMAGNCLLVAVTTDALTVAPRFPFNLMFLPEIYGLEKDIPLPTIARVERLRGWPGNNVAVFYGDPTRKLLLRLRDPDAFVAAIGSLTGRTV